MARKVIYYPRVGFRPFIMEVNSGASGSFDIDTDSILTYNYSLATSDFQTFHGLTGDLTITFPATNTDYLIKIYGIFPTIRIGYTSSDNRAKLKSVVFGDIQWESFLDSFANCINLTAATGFVKMPPIIQGMYNGDNSFNSPISSNDFSNVTNMAVFLNLATSYNQPININTVNCTNMQGAFQLISSPSLIIDCTSLIILNFVAFRCPLVTEFLPYNIGISFDIRFMNLLLGSAIDDVANVVRDLTGGTSRAVTMTVAQYNSGIDVSLWSAKNWTINQV